MNAFFPVRRALFLIALLLPGLGLAQTPEKAFVEGKDYQAVERPWAQSGPAIRVEEFFCYCCPHCYHADAGIEAWKARKAADVDFVRVANSLGRADGAALAEAFYVAQALGVGEKIHTPLFRAVHEEHLDTTDLAALKDFFQRTAGISPADYDRAADSLAVRLENEKAVALSRQYKIIGVPTVVVGGRYVTSPVMTGSEDRWIETIRFLTDKVRAERR